MNHTGMERAFLILSLAAEMSAVEWLFLELDKYNWSKLYAYSVSK